MGFDIYNNTVVLEFQGTRYNGATVTLRADVSLDEWEQYAQAEKLRDEWTWLAANALVSWNLERDGAALPLDTPFGKLPVGFVRLVVRKWTGIVVGIDAPLGQPSPDGGTAEAP
jgi:hypothetical protein